MKFILLLITFISFNVMALTPEAEKGKLVIAVCMACHNAELTPALGPPLYGVQNKYKQKYNNQQDFVNAISNWVKSPSLDNALMQRPVKMLGLMPAMSLPDEMLKSIGTYLYEEEFPAPCTHWANEIKNSEPIKNQGKGPKKGMGKGHSKGKNGKGKNHDNMILMKYNQLCQ